MKKFAPLFALLSLWAADTWQSKPFTEWSDKEVQKILTDSPWARAISVSTGTSTEPTSPFGGRGRSIGGDDEGPPRPDAGSQVPGADSGVPGGNVSSRRASTPDLQPPPSIPLLVRWQSALPVKQALAKRKFGSEAATSPEAQKFLDEDVGYLIDLSGLPPAMGRADTPQAKTAIREHTGLSVKGEGTVQPTDIVLRPAGKEVDILFVFPKTTAFTLQDKEIEFSTQIGSITAKCKFRLKDMVINGTLEL